MFDGIIHCLLYKQQYTSKYTASTRQFSTFPYKKTTDTAAAVARLPFLGQLRILIRCAKKECGVRLDHAGGELGWEELVGARQHFFFF